MVSPAHRGILSRFLPPWAWCPSSHSEEVEGGSPTPPAPAPLQAEVSGPSPGCPAGPAVCSQQALGKGLCASEPIPGQVVVKAGMGRQLVGPQLPSRRLSYQEGPERGRQEMPPSPPQCPRKALTPGRSGHPRWGCPRIAASPISVRPLTVLNHRACHQSLQLRYPRRVRLTSARSAHRPGYPVPPWHVPDGG